LKTILPLNRSPHNRDKIAFLHVELPRSGTYLGGDVDISSAVLGNLLLLVKLLAFYLEVPLPYNMTFFGSRSFLWDESSKSGKKYLLTFEGNSKEDFSKALDCLNCNIFQLCLSQGFEFEDGSSVLQYHLLNLLNFFNRCNALGSVLPQTIHVSSYFENRQKQRPSSSEQDKEKLLASVAYRHWGSDNDGELDDFVMVPVLSAPETTNAEFENLTKFE